MGNPNISGPELDAKKLVVETGYFQIKFGVNGFEVMKTVAQQVKNVPDEVETIVGIAGSGLSMLGVAMGCKLFNKNVKTIHPVALSEYVHRNRKASYDRLPDKYKFDGDFSVVQSNFPYQYKLKLQEGLPLDQTYEAKAWEWMINNIKPSKKVLFWDVGVKEYDLKYVEKIKWYKSDYETKIDREMRRKHEQIKHDFF